MMTGSSFHRSAALSFSGAAGACGWLHGRAFGFGLLFVMAATLLAMGCNNAAPSKEAKKVEVTVTTPITDDVIEYQDFTGRLDAFKTVNIRARTTGYITEAPFKEGDLVREGDLLFQIDSQPYEADLNLAEANLKLAEADATLQESIAARDSRLIQTGGIAREQYETTLATALKAKATVGAARATRDKAKLYLDYTHVVAPFAGRISRRLVDPGNDVTADSTFLTTLVTETPVYAYFDVDERSFLDLQKVAEPAKESRVGTKSGASAPMQQLQAKVLMRLANEDNFTRIGVVNFVDNRVIATTGTIRMRGVFENPKGDLTSGLFARVRLPTGKPYKAFLIPDEALQSDQGRKYLYVVNGNNEVEYRAVELGQAIEGLRVIKKGLSESDQVIVTGMQRVKPKQSVEVKRQEPPKPPESPLKQLSRKEEG
jgi:RND family efflux transporter MFP subunit